MARYIGVWSRFKDIVRDVLGYGCERTGIICLGFGKHEVVVRTECRPLDVYLSIKECHGHPVCHGDINMIGVEINHHGFVLYADVKTNTCEIEWIAEY